MTVEGMGQDYSGEAVNPKYLSLFEVMLGYGRRHGGRLQTESADLRDLQRGIPPGAIT